MRDCLGVSVGATNLVAARIDGTSTVRPASVPWRGTALTGFVERVGDPVPIVAPDGSAHHADQLMAAALTDLIRTAGRPGEPAGIALPAHWHGHVVARMRALLPAGAVTSDAVAALTALRAHPGLPARGVIVLCDFGATGTSVTLADASADFATIGATVRMDDFSGEAIDRSVLAYLLTGLGDDPTSTSAVATLAQFRVNCRMAKERLSFQSATGLPGPLPGTTVRLTRAELESLIRGPLEMVVTGIQDVLARSGVRRADLVAVASVGGGSRIPLVTQCLSAALGMPVTTTPQAQSVAAIGAALLAGREPELATRVAMAPRLASVPAAVEPQLLAWSSADVAEPIEYAGYADEPGSARPNVVFTPGDPDGVGALEPLAWYRRPAVLFAGAACAAVLAAAGLVVTTDVESVGTASAASVVSSTPSEAVPSEAVPEPVPSEVGGPPNAAAPEAATATVVVTPPPTIVRYTQVPAPQAPPVTATPTPTTPTTTTTTPTTTTTTPTTTAPTTATPTTATPATTTPAPSVTPTITSTVTSTIEPPPAPPTTTAPATVPPLETVLPTVPSQPVTAGDTASASR